MLNRYPTVPFSFCLFLCAILLLFQACDDEPAMTPSDLRDGWTGNYLTYCNCIYTLAGVPMDTLADTLDIAVSIPSDTSAFIGQNPPDYVEPGDMKLQLDMHLANGIRSEPVYVDSLGSFKAAIWNPHSSFSGNFQGDTLRFTTWDGGLGGGTGCEYVGNR